MKKFLQLLPKPFLVLLVACFVIVENPPLRVDFVSSPDDLKRAEFFPFSSFPMYSDFSPNPNYVYVSLPDGTALACIGDLDVQSSVLKKAYGKELRALKAKTGISQSKMTAEEKRPAGDAILRLVREEISPHRFEGGAYPALRLHEVIIRRGKKGIETEDQIVGDVRF